MRKTFAIFGSCVTRDAFELGSPTAPVHRVAIYLARTTINSCLAPPVSVKHLFRSARRKKFEERCVINDISKLHFDLLREKPFDYLLVDLIDERHWIMAIDGSYLCYSVPFLRMAEKFKLDAAKFERRSPRDPWVIAETLANIPRFVKRLCSIVDPKRIIVHEALWATSFIDAAGEVRPFPNNSEISRVNDVLAAYYARIKSEEALASISLPQGVCVADEKHRWRLEPFHYADIYYRTFLAELNRLTRTDTSSPARRAWRLSKCLLAMSKRYCGKLSAESRRWTIRRRLPSS